MKRIQVGERNERIVVEVFSDWRLVNSRVLLGLVLVQLLFDMDIFDLDDKIIKKFADDIKTDDTMDS